MDLVGQEGHLHPVYGILKDEGSRCIKFLGRKKSRGKSKQGGPRDDSGGQLASWKPVGGPHHCRDVGSGKPGGLPPLQASHNLLPPKLDTRFSSTEPGRIKQGLGCLILVLFYLQNWFKTGSVSLGYFATLVIPSIHALQHLVTEVWRPPGPDYGLLAFGTHVSCICICIMYLYNV